MLKYYETNDYLDYVAIETAECTGDDNEIIYRKYSNDVEIYYTVSENIIHLIYIFSNNRRNGNGS